MELRVSFAALWSEVDRISAERVDFDFTREEREFSPVDIELAEGIEVTLEDVEVENGLLTYKGRQVLLYIPDHGKNIVAALADPTSNAARRFHVADCKTLHTMKQQGRFGRYIATNRLENRFKIFGTHHETGASIKQETVLHVCQMCLNALNYKNFENLRKAERRPLWLQFTLMAFFADYSTSFARLPKTLPGTNENPGYTADWAEISRKTRERCGYRCDECALDLSAHIKLLHVHHINGVKDDNSALNLRALCADCHRKQPKHGGMFIASGDMALITRLRREQNLLRKSWDAVMERADTSIHGALYQARASGFEAPEIGYPLSVSDNSETHELPAAWPSKRVALVVQTTPQVSGWQILRPSQFLTKQRGST